MTNLLEEPPCKVAHIVGFEDPGLCLFGLFDHGCFGFGQGDDLDGFFGGLGLLPAGKLCGCQYLLIVLAFARGADDVVGRDRHLDLEVAKGEGELTAARELVVLPALEIAVYAKAGIPLGHGEEVVAVFGEIFIAAPSAVFHTVGNVIIPVDLKNEFLTGLQDGGQLHAHHGLIDHVFQTGAHGIGDLCDIVAIVVVLLQQQAAVQPLVAHHARHSAAVLVVGIVLCAVLVLIQLQPKISELVGRVVEVGDRFRPHEPLLIFIQRGFDVIVTALLPVFGAGGSAGRAVFIRGRQYGAQRFEFITVIGSWIVLGHEGATGGQTHKQ